MEDSIVLVPLLFVDDDDGDCVMDDCGGVMGLDEWESATSSVWLFASFMSKLT